MSPKHFRRILKNCQFLLVFLWTILVGVGFWKLITYANTPGELAEAHLEWPKESILSRDSHFSTLIIFVHPHCPCSEASVGELARLMPHFEGKVKAFVIFFKPKNASVEWVKEGLWKKVHMIPGVQVVLDEGGYEAVRFDAKTSGQTFLYDSVGKLIFNGGITAQRGHMGDSIGRNAILTFVQTGKAMTSKSLVFGCSLKNPERAGDRGIK